VLLRCASHQARGSVHVPGQPVRDAARRVRGPGPRSTTTMSRRSPAWRRAVAAADMPAASPPITTTRSVTRTTLVARN
jgi:hypothetical protein